MDRAVLAEKKEMGQFPISFRSPGLALADRVAPTEHAGQSDDQQADLDEKFSAIEPVNGRILEGGIGEEAVPEKSGGGDVDDEMEGFPESAAEPDAEIGTDNHDNDNIERDCADSVLKRLARGVQGVEKIDDAELCGP